VGSTGWRLYKVCREMVEDSSKTSETWRIGWLGFVLNTIVLLFHMRVVLLCLPIKFPMILTHV
jgi:hypothetical protein